MPQDKSAMQKMIDLLTNPAEMQGRRLNLEEAMGGGFDDLGGGVTHDTA